MKLFIETIDCNVTIIRDNTINEINYSYNGNGSEIIYKQNTNNILLKIIPTNNQLNNDYNITQIGIVSENFSVKSRENLYVKIPPNVITISFIGENATIDASKINGLMSFKCKTNSGSILVDSSFKNHIETISGIVTINEIDGEAIIKTTSGNIKCKNISGEIKIKTVSGEITIVDFTGRSGKAETISGNITLGGVHCGRIETSTISGKITRII